MSSPAFISGRTAARRCVPLRCNPFERGTIEFAQWTYGWDQGKKYPIWNYGQDVGNLHVIDYRLWLADLPIRRPIPESPHLRFSPADWSR
jgi:hypothetical protein